MDLLFDVRYESRRRPDHADGPVGGELRSGGLDEVDALRLLHRAASKGSEDADFHFILGEALLRAGRHDEAVAALGRAAEERPDDADYRLALAEALWSGRRFEEAALAFRAAAELQPSEADAWSGLGASLLHVERWTEAFDALVEAQERDATRPEIHSNLGVARWGLGEHDRALRHLRAGAAIAGAPAWVHHNLARALRAFGQLSPAINSLREATRLAPQEAEAHADLGDALLEAGEEALAEAAYRESASLSPSCLEARPESLAAYRVLATRSLRAELGIRRSLPRQLAADLVSKLAGALALGLRLLRRPVLLVALGVPTLLLLVAASRLGPHYLTYLLFSDDLATAARAPTEDEAHVRELVRGAIEDRRLGPYLSNFDCRIDVSPPWRTITCPYEVPVAPLPWWRERLRFRATGKSPFVVHQ